MSEATTQIQQEKPPLPSGYETVSRGPRIIVPRTEIPWLDKEEESIQLARIKIVGGQDFYLGSIIRGKKLTAAANALDEHRSRISNNLLNTAIAEYIRTGFNPSIKIVDNKITRNNIYYTGNQGGQRVYFMRMDKFLRPGDKLPIIVRIASCDKAQQNDVLSVITSSTHRQNKRLGRL